MKIRCLALLFLSLFIPASFADSYTYTATLTNAQNITYSDALPVSGYLEKIEFAQDSAATTTVTVATYASTTAIDTYATAAVSTTTKLFRPRVVGTDNGGTALAAVVVNETTNTVATTQLQVPYERSMLGGNVKVALTGTANDGSNPVTVTIFFDPVEH